MTEKPRDWEARYRQQDMPWDSGLVDRELISVLDGELSETLSPKARVLELGCGTGTNAIHLAEEGLRVTAVDISPTAIQIAREKAEAKGVHVDWVTADLNAWSPPDVLFDFVFDRGCYHCLRKIDVKPYLRVVRAATETGSHLLTITGNANSTEAGGPPKVTPQELLADFDELFELVFLKSIRLEDAGHVEGPLAWSALWRRR